MKNNIIGVILAGGQSQRFGGGDKGQNMLVNKTILANIITRLDKQLSNIAIYANGDKGRFKQYNLPVFADIIDNNQGPLAGILSGLEWVNKNYPKANYMVSIPTDCPFIPLNLVKKLIDAINSGAQMACVKTNNRHHPVIAIWPISLRKELSHAIIDDGIRKVDRWTMRYNIAHVEFTTNQFDPFFNINNADDLIKAEQIYKILNISE